MTTVPITRRRSRQTGVARALRQGLAGLQSFLKSLPKLLPRSVRTFLSELWFEVNHNNLSGLASELAYSFIFALFPFLIALVALTPFLPIQGSLDRLLAQIRPFLPESGYGLIAENLHAVATERHGALLAGGFLVALWSASGATVALTTALNLVYGVQESRPVWKTRGLALLVTVAGSLVTLLALAVIVGGGSLGEWAAAKLGLAEVYSQSWVLMRWPVAVALFFLVVSAIHLLCPDLNLSLRRVSWGALVSALLWLGTSLGFSWYATNFTNFNATYGSLGAVMLFLTWLQINGFIVILGGQINAVLLGRGGQCLPRGTVYSKLPKS